MLLLLLDRIRVVSGRFILSEIQVNAGLRRGVFSDAI